MNCSFHHRLLILSILVATLLCGSAVAQPAVTALGPGASYFPDGLSGSGIAEGSFFYLKGASLGPIAPVIASTYPLGTSLAGVSLKVTVGNQSVDAFPWYVSQSQINAILPSGTPLGLGNAQVSYAGLSASIPINVVPAAFGIFTLNGNGSGAAVITDQNYAPITLVHSAHPGDALVLWGTGLGAAPFPDNQPAAAGNIGSRVELFVGGKPAAIKYAGRAPGSSALDQINFVVPDQLDGCRVSIAVRINGAVSNVASLAVAPSGMALCGAGTTFGYVVAKASTQGQVATSTFYLSQGSGRFTAYAEFLQWPLTSLLRTTQYTGSGFPISSGDCSVLVFQGNGPDVDIYGPTPLYNAGAVSIYRPSGLSFYLTYFGLNFQTSQAGVLDPGPYELSVSGPQGSGVSKIQVPQRYDQLITWTNASSITTVDRSKDLTVSWNSTDLSLPVTISGGTSTGTGGKRLTGSFTCQAAQGSSSFTIPAYVLTAMPINSPGAGSLGIGTSLRAEPLFAAWLDVTSGSFDFGVSKSVDFQ